MVQPQQLAQPAERAQHTAAVEPCSGAAAITAGVASPSATPSATPSEFVAPSIAALSALSLDAAGTSSAHHSPHSGATSARRSPREPVLSVAPMMEWTTRHYRYLLRLLSRRTLVYTEMYVANTLLHSPHARGFLRFSPAEHPVACQVGGSDPAALARAAALIEAAGYDEVNLNCGCPSPRVAGKGAFGAALMFSPELVRDCCAAMRAAVSIPVTVKCRLGADGMDSYDAFADFVTTVAQSGVTHFVVHARKCLLKGLDPKGNRTIPPLRYAWVQRLAVEHPHLRVSINGGVVAWEQAEQLLALARDGPPLEEGEGVGLDGGTRSDDDDCQGPPSTAAALASAAAKFRTSQEGQRRHDAAAARLPLSQFHTPAVRAGPAAPAFYGSPRAVLSSVMIGRAAYHAPWMFADADRRFFGEANPAASRREVLREYLAYAEGLLDALPPEERALAQYKTFELAKPLGWLFQGDYGGGRFRKALFAAVLEAKLPLREALAAACAHVSAADLDAPPGDGGGGGHASGAKGSVSESMTRAVD